MKEEQMKTGTFATYCTLGVTVLMWVISGAGIGLWRAPSAGMELAAGVFFAHVCGGLASAVVFVVINVCRIRLRKTGLGGAVVTGMLSALLWLTPVFLVVENCHPDELVYDPTIMTGLLMLVFGCLMAVLVQLVINKALKMSAGQRART